MNSRSVSETIYLVTVGVHKRLGHREDSFSVGTASGAQSINGVQDRGDSVGHPWKSQRKRSTFQGQSCVTLVLIREALLGCLQLRSVETTSGRVDKHWPSQTCAKYGAMKRGGYSEKMMSQDSEMKDSVERTEGRHTQVLSRMGCASRERTRNTSRTLHVIVEDGSTDDGIRAERGGAH